MNRPTLLLALAVGALPLAACPGQPECSNAGDICTVAGTGTAGFRGDEGPAIAADLYMPVDLAIGPDKQTYIVDWNNHRIRQITTDGKIHTIAGTGELGDGTGIELESSFNHPTSIVFDPLGRIVIAAWHNSRVKRLDPGTKQIENICGTGKRAYSGDGGPASKADLDLPTSVAFDADGNLFVMDQANQVIRKIDQSGTIQRIAGQCIIGTPASETDVLKDCPNTNKHAYLEADPDACTKACSAGFGGDGGPATEARIAMPVGQAADPGGRIAFDKAGNLFLSDTKNHRIRKIDTAGVITTVAGTGTPGFSGDGGPATKAQLNKPVDVEVAADGTVYFTDTGNSCVRAIAPDATIRTVAGTCTTPGGEGDGGPATKATLDHPYGLTLDREGNLYIADTQNSRIRMVKK